MRASIGTIVGKTVEICKLVPLLPVVVAAAVPLAMLWDWRPWGAAAPWGQLGLWGMSPNPSMGQWVVIVLVVYTVVDTLLGMIDDLRHGQVGIDLLAIMAILSTLCVGEYWAAWAVTLMIASGEAIEGYAQSAAEGSLTALMQAAPRVAHVVALPGVGAGAGVSAAAGGSAAENRADRGEGDEQGFRHVMAGAAGSLARPAGFAFDPDGSGGAAASGANHFRTVPVEDVAVGDALVVLPGETVPVDGTLLSGSATLDLSNINGEPLPREVFAGARVMSGAINGSTTLTMRAAKPAAESQYQHILELVAGARESRPAVVKTADRLAVPFTVLSLIIAGLAWWFAGTPTRFAQVLVLATPCPLLIAAPVAYVAGTGRLAKTGVLIKTQDVLERLGRVTHVFFDKTGTLTVKQPQVVRVEMLPGAPTQLDGDHVLMLAGVVEGYSVHILSKGIAKAGAQAMGRLRERFDDGRRACPEFVAGDGRFGTGDASGIDGLSLRDYPVVRNIHEESGHGVAGEVNGHDVRVGRLSFANAAADGFQPVAGAAAAAAGATDPSRSNAAIRTRFGMLQPDEMASYVSVDGVLVARIVLRDVPRADAKAAVGRLRALGVRAVTMLTGDKKASAKVIAGEVGIDDVRAELFPEDKVEAVRAAGGEPGPRGARNSRAVTMMVGDGVNDAPVLAAADLGVAMTDGTSTAASESAQIVIMNDSISAVPQSIAIARRTRRVMLQAVLLGLALAVVGMVAAAFDIIPVVVGAFLQEGIDVVSILWALTAVLDRD
ncbi:heavy metal translocating P-type ATPase [Bifidobacterium vespertilionis]|uniref:Heavy metal translocating P-type ATPase n=1 Tax=Bifidobacterium vespertilionis TaxID=2562524 RepID=A0A5J5DVG4_9BIFI|nr:heavy metal translocating P-type ATPase [Bifidobacterium vespertilionis]KAA8820794.1 heavy metal translocating P-type ATPase [Bifidobacterium vespertilionis]KAA8822263.1 heavy metal translocating P-type ATPase [Bifidobacterium vespertilionis]